MTPEEIVNREIKQALRGYAIPEVDALLDELADQIERDQAELGQLRAQLASATSRLEEAQRGLDAAREAESTLTRTLVTAQEAAERALAAAHREADDVRGAAQREADDVRGAAQREADELRASATREADELRASSTREADELRASVAAEVEQQRAAAERDTAVQREEARQAAIALLEQARAASVGEVERARALQAIDEQHRATLRRHLELQLAALDELEPPPVPDLHDVQLPDPSAFDADADDQASSDGDGDQDERASDDQHDGVGAGWGDDEAPGLTVRVRELEEAGDGPADLAEASGSADGAPDHHEHGGWHDEGHQHPTAS